MKITIENYFKKNIEIKKETKGKTVKMIVESYIIFDNVHNITLYQTKEHTIISYKEKYERINKTNIYIKHIDKGINVIIER